MPEFLKQGLAVGTAVQRRWSSPWIWRWFRCWCGRAPGISPTSTPRSVAAEPCQIAFSSHTSEAGLSMILFALNRAMKPCREPCRQQTAALAIEPGLAADLVLLRSASFTVKIFEMSHLVKKKKSALSARSACAPPLPVLVVLLMPLSPPAPSQALQFPLFQS